LISNKYSTLDDNQNNNKAKINSNSISKEAFEEKISKYLVENEAKRHKSDELLKVFGLN